MTNGSSEVEESATWCVFCNNSSTFFPCIICLVKLRDPFICDDFVYLKTCRVIEIKYNGESDLKLSSFIYNKTFNYDYVSYLG